jgi:hypothetical protein
MTQGMIHFKGKDWSKGRSFAGTVSLRRSLTWIPGGTDNCCQEHAEENLLNGYLTRQRYQKEMYDANHA